MDKRIELTPKQKELFSELESAFEELEEEGIGIIGDSCHGRLNGLFFYNKKEVLDGTNGDFDPVDNEVDQFIYCYPNTREMERVDFPITYVDYYYWDPEYTNHPDEHLVLLLKK